jgi:hypothetical protein
MDNSGVNNFVRFFGSFNGFFSTHDIARLETSIYFVLDLFCSGFILAFVDVNERNAGSISFIDIPDLLEIEITLQ